MFISAHPNPSASGLAGKAMAADPVPLPPSAAIPMIGLMSAGLWWMLWKAAVLVIG